MIFQHIQISWLTQLQVSCRSALNFLSETEYESITFLYAFAVRDTYLSAIAYQKSEQKLYIYNILKQ